MISGSDRMKSILVVVLTLLFLVGTTSAYDKNEVLGYVLGALDVGNLGVEAPVHYGVGFHNETTPRLLNITATIGTFNVTKYGAAAAVFDTTPKSISEIAVLNSKLMVIVENTLNHYPGYFAGATVTKTTPDESSVNVISRES